MKSNLKGRSHLNGIDELDRNQILFQILEWVFLILALIILSTAEQYSPFILFSLPFLLGSISFRYLRTQKILPKSGFELPVFLFLVSASISAWVAFDRFTSLLQLLRILTAAVLFYAIIASLRSIRYWLIFGLVLIGVGFALYWPIYNDFSVSPVKFYFLNEIGLWINQNFPHFDLTLLTGPTIHANVAAGALALIFPFSLYLVLDAWRSATILWFLLFILVAGLILFTIMLTGSRGAWLGLAAASLFTILILVQKRWFTQKRDVIFFWSVISIGFVIFLALFQHASTPEDIFGQIPGPTGTLQSRTDLWRQGLGLIRDFPLTGIGLMSFWLVHSSYSLLIHVPYIAHVHNAFLEVWIEQGILGALSLLIAIWIVLTWIWQALKEKSTRSYAWAGIFSLVIVAFHGIFDVVFYIERTLPLVGFALGFTWFASPDYRYKNTPGSQSHTFSWKLPVLAILLLGVSLLFYRYFLAYWYVNIGSVSQTRTELGIYDPANFANLTFDQLRRANDLSEVQYNFERALENESTNPTALIRLAQIDLSRGDYESALDKMSSAWNAGYRDDVTRLLYGDSLVAAGQVDRAYEVLKGVTWAESRLMGQAWDRYRSRGDFQRAVYAWQTVLKLNPNNQIAQPSLLEDQARVDE